MPKVIYVSTTAEELEDWADQLLEASQQFAAAATVMHTEDIEEIELGAREQTERGVKFVTKGAFHLNEAVSEAARKIRRERSKPKAKTKRRKS